MEFKDRIVGFEGEWSNARNALQNALIPCALLRSQEPTVQSRRGCPPANAGHAPVKIRPSSPPFYQQFSRTLTIRRHSSLSPSFIADPTMPFALPFRTGAPIMTRWGLEPLQYVHTRTLRRLLAGAPPGSARPSLSDHRRVPHMCARVLSVRMSSISGGHVRCSVGRYVSIDTVGMCSHGLALRAACRARNVRRMYVGYI